MYRRGIQNTSLEDKNHGESIHGSQKKKTSF